MVSLGENYNFLPDDFKERNIYIIKLHLECLEDGYNLPESKTIITKGMTVGARY